MAIARSRCRHGGSEIEGQRYSGMAIARPIAIPYSRSA
jgi:hypothetical protein